MADTSLSAQIEHDYKVSKWSRNTVADGSWLQKYTVERLTNRDIFLANAIDTLNSGTDENLSSLSAAISYVSATHDEYIDYLSATLSGTIYDVSALNEKVSSFSSEYKTFVSATNNRFNNIESNASGLQNQIDQLKIATDVINVFGTHDEFTAASASTWQQQVTDNDTIKVLNDNDEYQVYYEWHDPNSVQPHTDWTGWSAIGSLDPYYSTNEIDDYFEELSATVSNNYLSAKGAVLTGRNIAITENANYPKITIATKDDVDFNTVSAATAYGSSAKFTNISATNISANLFKSDFGTVDTFNLKFNSATGDKFTTNEANIIQLTANTLYGQSNNSNVDSLIGSAQSGKFAWNVINSAKFSAIDSTTSTAYLSGGFAIKAGDNLTLTYANKTITLNAGDTGITAISAGNTKYTGPVFSASAGTGITFVNDSNNVLGIKANNSLITSAKAGSAASAWVNNTLFDYSYTDYIDTKSTSGSIDKITILYKNDSTDHDVMYNQEVVFERDNYSVSGLLIQAANSTDNGKVLTYNSTANNYTWQPIPPTTYSTADYNISINNSTRKIGLATTGIKTSAYSAEYIIADNTYNSILNGAKLNFSYGNSILDLSLTGVSYIHGGTSDSAKWDNLFKNYAQVNRGQIDVSNDLTEDKVNFIVATGSQVYTAVNFKITSTVPSILEDNVYYII